MSYLVVRKQPLFIIEEMTIPIPMSHGLESKAAALRWMTERSMQNDCKVMNEDHFNALNGWAPRRKNDN